MTAGAECILGASLAPEATEPALKAAYGVFAEEAKALDAHYVPDTVNTDGWKATRNAWKRLFPQVVVILCFLHALLKIRDRATKKMKEAFDETSDKVWSAYRAEKKRPFSQRLRRLKPYHISFECITSLGHQAACLSTGGCPCSLTKRLKASQSSFLSTALMSSMCCAPVRLQRIPLPSIRSLTK